MKFISLITCTKDRPEELNDLLTSIRAQVGARPDLHIIIDGSDNPEPVKKTVDQFRDLPIEYHHLRPPGLTRQKNFGISCLPEQTDWVGVLDDDVVLDKNCLKNIKYHIESDNEVRGIGVVFSNLKRRKYNILRNILLIDGRHDGGFSLSGLPISNRTYDKNTSVKWLHGGATFWHKQILDEFDFDEWFSGIGYFEDIDFSYRVSRKNKLIFLPDAQSTVYDNYIPTAKLTKVGTWQVVAWWYFATRKGDFNKFLICYSILGVIAVNLFMGIVRPSSRRILNTWGNLRGLAIIISGKTLGHQGFQK
jgi:glycosyltransferase involved in cell wall biosynthesis